MNRFSKHFQSSFEQIRDPLLVVDADGNIRDSNPVARAVFDLGDRNDIRDVVSLERSFAFDAGLVLSLLEQPAPVLGRRLKDSEGNDTDVVLDILDLSSRRGRQPLKLIHVKDYTPYRSYDHWKDELISMVAHEIKNPLAAMKNSMDVLISQATEGMTEGQRSLLNVSVRSIDRLTRLLDNFLDVSRISSGSYAPEPRWVDAHEFTAEVISTFKTLFNVRRQRLECRVSGEIDRIYVDAPKLEQILINLLNNAIKFTDEGGQVTVSVERSSLEALDDDLRILPWSELAEIKFVRFVVKDTGIGMTEDTLAHLFTRYYKKKRGGAMGSHLGLNISKTLVEVQNGTLEFESELGVGTVAAVSIPADDTTFMILSRVKSIERVLSRFAGLRRGVTFSTCFKDGSRPWMAIINGSVGTHVVNPAVDEEEAGNRFVWTLSDRLAVSLTLGEQNQPLASDVFAGVDCEDHTEGFSVLQHQIPEDGSSVAALMGLALKQARRMSGV